MQIWSLGGEDPWGRIWQHTPVFLPEKFQGAWWATVHGFAKSQTPLSDWELAWSVDLTYPPNLLPGLVPSSWVAETKVWGWGVSVTHLSSDLVSVTGNRLFVWPWSAGCTLTDSKRSSFPNLLNNYAEYLGHPLLHWQPSSGLTTLCSPFSKLLLKGASGKLLDGLPLIPGRGILRLSLRLWEKLLFFWSCSHLTQRIFWRPPPCWALVWSHITHLLHSGRASRTRSPSQASSTSLCSEIVSTQVSLLSRTSVICDL